MLETLPRPTIFAHRGASAHAPENTLAAFELALAQGADGLSPEANCWTRVGLGHPEGFFEAFANLYTEVAEAIATKSEGRTYAKAELGYPDASDGVRGVAFVESAMRSFAAGSVWTAVEDI